VKRCSINAVRAILIFLALCGVSPALLTRPAQAATVFSNYTGVQDTGIGGLFFASGFTPADNYDFTGAAAFVENLSVPPRAESFSMALYSSTSAGAPYASLWASGTLTIPGPSNNVALVSANYSGSPISLRKGVEYFLVLDLSGETAPAWLFGGSSSTPFYQSFNNGTSWDNAGPTNDVQYEITGSPVAAIPEPSTWAMLLLGFAGLGLAVRRKAAGAIRLV
jgi:hypothetical protein